MIDFQETVASILAAESNQFYERDPETFFASQIGFCLRQLYVNKLGLTESETLRGKYKAANLIQSYFEQEIGDQHPELETSQSVHLDEGLVQFAGTCTFFNPEKKVVYGLKVRNGWYQFSPPIERHIDQLQVYMRGMDVDRGKLIYVSKNDIGDIREWPSPDAEFPFVELNKERYNRLVEKATTVRNQIWKHGIASRPGEIPFEKCECYFCREESLTFSDATPTEGKSSSTHLTSNSINGGDKDPVKDATISTAEMGLNDEANESSPIIEVDGGNVAETPQSDSESVLTVDSEHVPQDLRELDVWVVWDGQSKLALAPWQEGTMYPCEWAASKDVDPRRSFEKARIVANLPMQEIHHVWPFPDEDDFPDRVYPAVLLQNDPPDPPLTFVDFDDVRDPDTGMVPTEVSNLIDSLGGYAELSQSGTGLHVYVRGKLPAGVNAFTAPLEERGSIEIYDHSRFTGGTWHHIEGTPRDTVPNAESVIESIVTKYGPARPQL